MYRSGGPAAALAPATAPAPSAPVDPMSGGNEAWLAYLGKGSVAPTAFAGQMASGGRPMTAHIGTPPTLDPLRSNGRWALCDEKYMMLPGLASNKYDTKSPQTWLQATRNYIVGRTSEFDPLLNWVEAQIEPFASSALISAQGRVPIVDAAGNSNKVSRQLWGAILNSLLSHDEDTATMFANVEHHNGLEVWRRLAEPLNEDTAMVR